jgi:hypothetical protein
MPKISGSCLCGVGRKDPDALVRLLIKQQQKLLSVAESVEYIPHLPMEC